MPNFETRTVQIKSFLTGTSKIYGWDDSKGAGSKDFAMLWSEVFELNGSGNIAFEESGGNYITGTTELNWDDTNKILSIKGKDTTGSEVLNVKDSAGTSQFKINTDGTQLLNNIIYSEYNSASISISPRSITSLADFTYNIGGGAVGMTGQSNSIFGSTSGDALTTGNSNALLGADSGKGLTTGSQNVLIGNQAGGVSSNLSNCVMIGHQAQAGTGANSQISIGRGSGSTTAYNGSISIGTSTAVTAANQLVFGSNSYKITNVYFGSGVQNNDIAGAGTDYTIRGAGGYSTGAGGNLILKGGLKAGATADGSVIIKTPTADTNVIEVDDTGLGFLQQLQLHNQQLIRSQQQQLTAIHLTQVLLQQLQITTMF